MNKKFNFSQQLKNIAILIMLAIGFSTVVTSSAYAGGEDSYPECYPYTKLSKYDTTDCTLCPVFRVVFNTVSEVASKTSKAFSKPSKIVVAVAFAVWLAIYLLKYLLSMEARDIKDVFQELITKGAAIVLVIVILDTGASNFYKWLINPVYETTLKGANMALDETSASSASSIVISSSRKVAEKQDGLPASMGNTILETMAKMESNILKVRAFGSSLICYSWAKRVLFIIPQFRFLIPGLFFWIMAIAMTIIIPLLLIDAVLQLAVAVALLPPAIACFPFKVTKQYPKKTWETFLNSAFSFMFTALVLIMVIGVIKTTVENMTEGTGFTWDDIMAPPDEGGSESSSEEEPKAGAMDEYIINFGWFQGRVVKCLFIFLLCWVVLNMGKDFANELASSLSSTSIGSSIGTMASSSVKGMSGRILSPLKNYAEKSMDKRLNAFASGSARRRSNRAQKKWNKQINKAESKGKATNNGQQTSYTKKRFFGKTVTYTRDNARGNVSRTKSKGAFGKLIDKTKNKINNAFRPADKKITNYSESYRIDRVARTHFTTYKKVKVITGTRNGQAFTEERIVSKDIIANDKNMENLFDETGRLDDKKVQSLMSTLDYRMQKKMLQIELAEKLANDCFKNNKTLRGGIIKQETKVQNGKIAIVMTTAKGEKRIIEVVNSNNPDSDLVLGKGGRLAITSTTIDRKGKARRLSTDGLYNCVEEFKLFNSKDDRATRRRKLASINNMNDVISHARCDKYGKVKVKASWYETSYADEWRRENYDSPTADIENESLVLPKQAKVNKLFGKGAAGYMQGDQYLARDGSVIASKKKDEHGNQIYMGKFGKQFAGIRDEDGKLRVIKGYDENKNPILGRRILFGIEVMSRENSKGEQDDLMIQNGLISDAYSYKVYGWKGFVKNSDRKFDEAKNEKYFKL